MRFLKYALAAAALALAVPAQAETVKVGLAAIGEGATGVAQIHKYLEDAASAQARD